ncbi:MAG: NADP-dependent glyceraldehyde-3-phosphate dehydrogenase [Bacillus sp. (in: firmicutes)]
MSKTYDFYINGEWRKSESGETISISSPYLRKEIGKIQAMTQQEIDESIQSAKVAQVKWADLTVRERGEYLYRWIDELLKDKESIAEMIMKEVGKAHNDALKEVDRTADFIRYTIEEAYHMHGESIMGENFVGGNRSKIATVHRVPLGVILAIAPFNYPVNLSAAKIAPALIAGNSVIYKPATQGALSGIKMIEALERAGLPAGVLNVVTGRGSVIGDYLVEHKDISMISFTGGTRNGLHIAGKSKMVPLVMELGGKDPAIVREDADLPYTAKQIVSGAYSYSGQRCTAIKRVLAHESVADELVKLLHEEVKQLTVGSPADNKVIVPLIDDASADYVQGLIDDAIEKGATVVAGNKREENLIYPTLIDHVTPEMEVAWQEPFGPVLPVIRVQSDEEAIRLANESEFGLQASIFTSNINQAFLLAPKIETGTVQINGRTERGPDHFPFIGVKGSGTGTQGIRRSIESMSREKVTVLNIHL